MLMDTETLARRLLLTLDMIAEEVERDASKSGSLRGLVALARKDAARMVERRAGRVAPLGRPPLRVISGGKLR